ncbi:uncharacterized protein FIBRA_00649 [Fibroporia radiculosa]|uniref:Uncharacterized protein n=1 Tax=Fibroporia radiculosa TaxID=599839 RepID=J4HRY5_9APHY|nr:uncharacterized protein FIBRA_00649 [Fibroporia radiculosa]CCL98647.1 predicted protein [Fibroporia radiculosa]
MNYKPRNSVLYLFDPLRSPSTPRREPSPDSGSSDKENDIPPGEITVFFNRIYTTRNDVVKEASKGPLIDFGDTTVDESANVESNVSSEQESKRGELSGDDPDCGDINLNSDSSSRRVPLADIQLDDPFKMCESQVEAVVLADQDSSPPHTVTAAPAGAPLAEVINSINLSSMTLSPSRIFSARAAVSAPIPEQDGSADPVTEDTEDTISIPLSFPHITVSSPSPSESDSLTESDLPPTSDSPSDRLFASSSAAVPPTLRPPSSNTISPNDPRRTSVDLHASFSMHMQSAEMSFDLLNDKISFLGHGADSFWMGGQADPDSDFDLDEEERQMETHLLECEQAENMQVGRDCDVSGSPAVVPLDLSVSGMEYVASPRFAVASSTTSAFTEDDQLWTSPQPAVSDELSDAIEQTLERRSSIMSVFSPPEAIIDSPQAPVFLERRASISPLASRAVTIPALRIAKKTWKMHGHTDSSASAGSSASSSSSSLSTSMKSVHTISPAHLPMSQPQLNRKFGQNVALEQAAVQKSEAEQTQTAIDLISPAVGDPVPTRKTTIRGVQRPPVVPELTGSGVITPSEPSLGQRRLFTRSKIVPASVKPDTGRHATLGRFAAAGIQRPNLQQSAKISSTQKSRMAAIPKPEKTSMEVVGTTTGASATSSCVSTTALSRAGRSIGRTTGLRPPSQYGSVGRVAGVPSALPRPASRLLAPATTAGLKGKDAMSSSSVGRARDARAIPRGL